MPQNKETVDLWSQSAPYWEKHRAIILEMFAPITQALIESAEITRGSAVLDIATGPGEPALTIAEVVGPDGRAYGADPVPEMVEAARRETSRRGLPNASFEVAFADALPFPTDTFDAVVSRFGVMFFPAPIDAVREMLRVLKPGGRIALAVWGFAEKNPFHYSVSRVVDRYTAPPPPPPDTQDMFRFAAAGKLLTILSQAGVASPFERVLQFSIRAPLSAEDFWALRSEMSEKLRTRLAGVSKEQLAVIKNEVIEAFRQYAAGSGLSFPAEILIIGGRKALPGKCNRGASGSVVRNRPCH